MKKQNQEVSQGETYRVLIPRFLVDGMLGSLYRKLRILGFDTMYDKESNDTKLVLEAQKEGRILVTSDVRLQQEAKRRGVECVLITTPTDKERLVELFLKIGIKRLNSDTASRCSSCNGELIPTEEKTREGKEIYSCRECGKLYWKGGHWKKLEALFREVGSRLEN